LPKTLSARRKKENRKKEEEEGDDRTARIFIERQFKNPFSAAEKLNLYYQHVTVEPILYENGHNTALMRR